MPNFDVSTEAHAGDSWTLIDVTVHQEESEIVSDFLWSHGVVAIEEISCENSMSCLRSSVGEDPQAFLALLHREFPTIAFAIVHVEKSVSETWRHFAQPTWIDDDFVIVPQWLTAPAATRVLLIEPLDTFGLGNHPTTVLAMRLAMSHIPQQSKVFDLGTGSGVLAIAAAKFLACTALAYDIAHGAQQALRLNATLNDVNEVSWIDGYPHHTVDVVLANILAPVLIEEAMNISTTVRQGGVVILSGMRLDQLDKVLENFLNYECIDSMELDGWVAVALQKKEN